LCPFAAEDTKRVNKDNYRPCDEGDGVIGSHFAMVDIPTPTGPTIPPIKRQTRCGQTGGCTARTQVVSASAQDEAEAPLFVCSYAATFHRT
jgi:hypothetical protein